MSSFAPARQLTGLLLAAVLIVSSCGSESSTADITSDSATTQTEATTQAGSSSEPAGEDDNETPGIDPTAFFDGALIADPATIDCTLADGTVTRCYELTVAGFPANRDALGPWCPAATSDGAAGIWFDGEAVYDIDGQFILDLGEIYDDPTWQLYDEDGNVLSTNTSEAFNELVTGGPQADPMRSL